ncbi:MAG: major facilitator superfamily protein [Burkholderiales bacterium]|nr:major facilitator superfamily protein [Burkholderiales bacterium]
MPIRSVHRGFLLPPGTQRHAAFILWSRALRAFGDGYMSLLLPFYLTLLGFTALEVGVLVTATLLGSGAMTLAAGLIAHRYYGRTLLRAASLLMAATGIAFVMVTDFWPLLLVAFLGTLNPSSGDVSVFSPLEHALLAHTVTAKSRTALFARYSLIGAFVGALGAQAAGIPALAEQSLGIELKTALQGMFMFYGILGLASLALYQRLAPSVEARLDTPSTPLGESRHTVFKLAALFSLDAFAGGFAVQSLLALWLFERFDMSVTTAGTVFFWVGMLSALSQLASARVAARFGLINTMVFTHLPSSVFLILVPFMPTLPLALLFLFLRSALSQMDVPARTSYVMAVVSPGERPAAASVTAVPRSLAAAVSPAFAGYLLTLTTFGWPLIVCGSLKIIYDLLLLMMFRRVTPPEESK